MKFIIFIILLHLRTASNRLRAPLRVAPPTERSATTDPRHSTREERVAALHSAYLTHRSVAPRDL